MRAGCGLLAVVGTIAALGGFVECARADTILVEDASGPFSRMDGTGYANDIVRAAFASVGVAIAFDVVPYARCKESLIAGRTPACFSMSRSDTFDRTIVFSAQSIFEVVATVFQRRDAPRHWISLADVPPGARVGIVNGYEYPEGVYELQRSGVIMDATSDEIVNLKRLARGRIEAVIVMTDRYERIDQRAIEAGVAAEVMSSFNAGTLGSYVGFSTRHPDGERLRAKFDKGYQAIVRSGEKRAIDAKWQTHVTP